MIPSLDEAIALTEVLLTVTLLVCIFMVANHAALAASEAVTRIRDTNKRK